MPMAPLTPMSPAAPSSAGRFANRWQQRTGGGQQAVTASPILSEADKKKQRQLHAKRKYALSSALERGRIEEALEAAEDILLYGQSIPNDLLYRLICAAADAPGVERFAQVVNICTKADIKFDVMQWAALVGKLMHRDAPHAQVRVALNFGVQPDGDLLQLIPVEANRQSDVEKCFAGAENLDMGELSDENDLGVILHGRAAAGLRAPPKALSFGGCSFKKLNGTYFKCKRIDWESSLSRKPVYKKSDGPADRNPIYAYYYEPELKASLKAKAAGEEVWTAGWYIGTEVGGGGTTYAYCVEEKSELPPTFANWHVLDRKGEKEELLGFERVQQKKGSDQRIVEWDEARGHLEKIDLEALRGRVVDHDPESTKYFTHFFILLHLEHLAEVAGFRGRFGFRTALELASFGIALIDTEFDSKWGFTEESRRMPLPGWPDLGAQKVAFKLPRDLNKERFSIKRGESVLISRGEPLKSRVTEGSVTDVDLVTRLLVVNVNGQFPDYDFQKVRFRLDCYANRTTFERQLTALLQFVTMRRTKMQEMLIAAGVGKVDLAVLGGDGFADPSAGTKLGGKKKGDGKDGKGDGKGAALDTPDVKAEDGKKAAENIEELLELPDDGKDFGEDGTWVDVVCAEGDDVEEVEVEAGSDEEEKPLLGDPDDNGKGEGGGPEDDLPPPADDEAGVEDMAKRLAAEIAGDFEEGGAKPPPLDASPKSLGEVEDVGSQRLAKLLAGEAVEELPPELKPAPLDEPKDEEERIKRATLALAAEDAEGINPERLAEAKEMVKTLPDLSVAQRNAITNALSKRLTIVQGPPGTGKTHTSVRILTMWAKQMRYTPLLATSECNIAVDNIAEGLAKAGVKVVRIGRPEKVREVLEGVCLDNMVKAEREKRKEEAADELSELEELGEEPWDETSEEHAEWMDLRKRWRRRHAWERKQDAFARARFVEAAEVICATTVTAGSQALSGFKFHAILIDEVAQATEVSAIVPIICRGAKQIALCGDHCQLPPSTISREAELRGMSLSLYSRLVEAGVPFQFLDTQYRAHPALMEFSASCIYQGKLKNGIDGSQRPVPKGIPWPNPENPAAFFECGQPEGLNGESKDNPGEANQVLNLIEEILRHKDLTLNDIGVVTPYKGQVRTLRSKIFARFPEAVKAKELEIASVDNFQGREKELIVFSAVRSNKEARVGFLNDWRRLNVMITRARRGLVVIGTAATLVCDKHWRMWLQFTERQGGCPKGTVEKAIQEAQDNLEILGNKRLRDRIFPYKTVEEILAGTPAAAEDILERLRKKEEEEQKKKEAMEEAKKAREAKEKARQLEMEAGDGLVRDFSYLKEDDDDWQEEGDEDYEEVEIAVPGKAQHQKKRKAVAGTAGDADWGDEQWDDAAWEEGAAKKKPKAKAKKAASETQKSLWVRAEEWAGDDWDDGAAKKKPIAKAKKKAAEVGEWGDAAWADGAASAPAAKKKGKPAKSAEAEQAEWDDWAWEAAGEEEPEAAPASKRRLASEGAAGKKAKQAEEIPEEADDSASLWGILGAKPSLSKKS